MKIYLILLLVVIAGCAGGSGEEGLVIDVSSAFKGEDGLVMEFLDNAPSTRMLVPKFGDDPIPFTIALEIENKGAVDIEDGIVVASVEQRRIAVDEPVQDIELEGRARFRPGGKGFVVFEASLLPSNISTKGQDETLVSVSSCYGYKTIATVPVCIHNPGPLLSDVEPVCEVEDTRLSSQGAPVAIKRIEPIMRITSSDFSEVRPEFRVFVDNVGGGIILDELRYRSGCTAEDVGFEFFNNIHITAKLQTQELDCGDISLGQ